MKLVLIFFILVNYLNAMNCSDYKDFQFFNGHYYSISVDKLTFESAKQIAENNGGTLAIPNSSSENDFIKNLIDGGSIAWIGIYDPNNLQNYCYGSNCAYDASRFKDVKNNSLLYKNFASNQPDNLVKEYDVVDGKQKVSPLGEHWVAMNGNNGKWFDDGNHADKYNNPVKYKAVFEFENLNECKPLTDDGVQELTGRFCNTKIWDTTIDTLEMGQTLDCQTDINGNEYCPSALAECGEQWDYDNGYSVAGVGEVTDYTKGIITSIPASKANKTFFNMTDTTRDPSPGGIDVNFLTTLIGEFKLYISPNPLVWYFYLDNNEVVNGVYSTSTNIIDAEYNSNYFHLEIDGNSASSGGISYKRVRILTNSYYEKYYCNTGTLVGSTCQTLTCPIGYTETTGAETLKGECKKTREYTYYNYLCNNSQNTQGYNYTPTNSGGNTGKTDPNNTIINDTLDDVLNSSTPPTNNCKREKFTCQSNADRPCSYVDNKWQCSPFPCLGQSNLESLDTQVGKDDKNNDGWSEDGACTGTIYIFNGKSNKCRTSDMFFGLIGGGCCDKEKVFAGLVACKENEKVLAKKREQKQAHFIGNFCSKKLKLGLVSICVQKSDSYCTFNSSLGKIIQEQGREQLGISWGSPENPQCRGFTPDEFQKIDFSKIDLTEFVKDIQSNVQTSVIQNLGTYVKDKVGDFYGN